MKKLGVIAGACVALAAAGAAAMLYGGLYDISASDQHLAPTYWALDTAMRHAVRRRAGDISVPPLDDERLVARGLAHFRAHCVECHGAPGVAPAPFALGMTPAPANLVHTARAWQPAELFWVIKYGIKMTGMPAWEFRMPEEELWAIVAFMQRLPQLSPAQYRALQAPEHRHERLSTAEPPHPGRGKVAIEQYACVTCHRIPGIVGPNAPVGPPLEGMGARARVAGLLPNTQENLVRFLREPQGVHPASAMPDLDVSERDARDIAAYLLTLK
jgi:mono/diheme cytochrome c family protein